MLCCQQIPGTPIGSVSELLPRFKSETSAVSSCDDKPGNTSIFFARVPPLVPYEHLHELFSKFGTIKNLNLFRRWATAKTSKGCGTVQYTSTDEAAAALQALNGVHTFEGYPSCEGPIVVEWMDPAQLTSAEAAAGALVGWWRSDTALLAPNSRT
jgi:RNA recognition motif-containing protein